MNMLYLGAAGVIWAIQFLERARAVDCGAYNFTDLWPTLLENNQSALSMFNMGTASYWMGDAGILLVRWLEDSAEATASLLKGAIDSNTHQPALDFMWGAPGTMVAALTLFERTSDEQAAELFRNSAKALWDSLEQSSELDCKLWTQSLYGTQSQHVGAGHGFAGNVFPIIKGRQLLSPAEWEQWRDVIIQTVTATAVIDGDLANWPQSIGPPRPLGKGAGLCHGTAGNGYAFLKLFQRTQDEMWLERARAFAMHAISQYEGHAHEYGRGRYSLWTGDQGLAVFLWSCLEADHRFPTLDLF
jgi:lantibiotic modifying enzyme